VTAIARTSRRLPRVAARVAWALLPIVAVAALLAVLPRIWFEDSPYTTRIVVETLVLASYGVGFNVIFGCTSQLFLCVGALASVGGYAAAILADRASLPIMAGVAAGAAIAAIVGGVLSWLAVRRSLGVIFTGIVTLVFSLAFANLILGRRDLTGGDTGLLVPHAATRFANSHVDGYYVFAGLLVGCLLVFRLLQLSHIGWAFRALHDDETAAVLAGVAVARYRVYAAVIGSAMIGLTGALFAYSDGFITPDTYAFNQIDVRVLVLVAFGGLGTLLGPPIGAAVFGYVDEKLIGSGQLREAFYGAIIIAIFLGFRRGLLPTLVTLLARTRATLAGKARAKTPRPVLPDDVPTVPAAQEPADTGRH